ncbi:DUF445 domain-containing protein [Mycobacteroides abscessus]|uniref:DUF445 domain-containing protein n=1 Tax=Mycobacteroides abscessus TaxID=36809 RepID=UPI0009A5B89E|nr:DUF445 domain-containing protein [Mycobacteroides abscessus]MBE5471037.1 hypothetical protein [Mycobacteroides abscessus]MDM2643092.1 DUF445 domain-containing protein [Mycobacteroides abscessus]MDM2652895.1 DUF445 domain-containing protein [Mycobacteroides abscessus]MDM2662198.1 DUF445 domain-containing protein [Mycobacteroides abscessus]MDM2667306.1 DUF445 domain-containing protein [Mycobacteroides abscessus]
MRPMPDDGYVAGKHSDQPGARKASGGVFAMGNSAVDEQRRKQLRRMKAVATGFLIGATVLFLACRWWQSIGAPGWVGYVGAAAEAGMVGALADWFAVTALFRHPLGLKIPHTAIIKRKKDQLGEGLGNFVRENFMSPAVITAKVRDAQIAGRLGKWMSDRSHAERVAAEASTVLRVGAQMLRDEDVQQAIDSVIVRRIAEPKWGPPVGRVLATVLKEDRHAPVIQLLCDRAFEWALGASDTIDRVVVRDSPSWTPKFVDHFVGDRIYRELVDFTDKVRRNPEHDLRQSVNRLLYEFADDLQHDDLTIAKAEAVKARLMARAEVQNAAATAWSAAKKMITESVDDPSSELRTRIADTVVRIGETLRDDAGVRDKVDGWVERAARHLVDQYGAEITAVITETIERWDADEASRRIELHVGRDLQFIRINGTVVGSLAGLVIYTVAQLLF